MRQILRIALFILPLMSASALADSSCWNNFQEVDFTENWNFPSFETTNFYLPSHNINGRFLTPAAAHFTREQNAVRVHFDFQSNKMSLPYNLYRIEIEIGGPGDAHQYSEDFTSNCQEPGLAIYPGSSIQLPEFEIPPRSDGSSRAQEPVHIKIWGHL